LLFKEREASASQTCSAEMKPPMVDPSGPTGAAHHRRGTICSLFGMGMFKGSTRRAALGA